MKTIFRIHFYCKEPQYNICGVTVPSQDAVVGLEVVVADSVEKLPGLNGFLNWCFEHKVYVRAPSRGNRLSQIALSIQHSRFQLASGFLWSVKIIESLLHYAMKCVSYNISNPAWRFSSHSVRLLGVIGTVRLPFRILAKISSTICMCGSTSLNVFFQKFKRIFFHFKWLMKLSPTWFFNKSW